MAANMSDTIRHAMNGNGRIKNFTGIARNGGDSWWAYCNQLPVCAQGKSFNEAVQNIIEAIQAYHEPLNGSRPPKMKRAPEVDGGTPFRITVDTAPDTLP